MGTENISMKDEFEKLVATGKISRPQMDALLQLTDNGYCMHRSWGFGKITTVDTVFGRFVIDFQTKKGHTMDLAFAAESLKPIPKDHILARKVADIENLRQMAALHHLELIKLVLQSYGGRATVDQIQQVLVPDVIRDDWKKWWEAAKRELKKDGHFQVPLKKIRTDRLSGQGNFAAGPFDGRFPRRQRFESAPHGRARNVEECFRPDRQTGVPPRKSIAALNAEIATHQRTQPAVALEAIFVRDDIREAAGLPAAEGEITARAIWAQEAQARPVARSNARRQTSSRAGILQGSQSGSLARSRCIDALNNVSAKLATELRHAADPRRQDRSTQRNARPADQPASGQQRIAALAGQGTLRHVRRYSRAGSFPRHAHRDGARSVQRKAFQRLRDFILDDQQLLVELIGSADLEVIKDLTRALQLSPCFDDMDKRSLLARIVKSYPADAVADLRRSRPSRKRR